LTNRSPRGVIKAKLPDEARKSALVRLSGWSEVAHSNVASHDSETPYAVSARTSFFARIVVHRSARRLLWDFGAKQCDEPSVTHGLAFDVPLLRGIRSRRTTQLCAKICIRRPAPDSAMAFLNRMPQLASGCVLLDAPYRGWMALS
jgi:hypothetical protein